MGRKIKLVLSLMSILSIIFSIYISIPVCAEPSAQSYVVWDANPDRTTSLDGGSLTVSSVNFTNNKQEAIRNVDDDGNSYIQSIFKNQGSGSRAIIKSGIGNGTTVNGKKTFAKWVDDQTKTVFKAIEPYLTLEFDVRATKATTGYFYLVQPYGIYKQFNTVRLTTKWEAPSLKIKSDGPQPTWYNCYFGVEIYDSKNRPNGAVPINVDLKNVRITVMESDRDAITAALAKTGSDITFDELISFDIQSWYSSSEREGYHRVLCTGDNNVSPTVEKRLYKSGETVSINAECTYGYAVSKISVHLDDSAFQLS